MDPELRRAFLGAASGHNPAASRLGAAGLTNIRLEKPRMTRTFMPPFKTVDELAAHQLQGLKWTVRHAYEGSSFYRAKLDEAGITPDDIKSLDDLRKLPFATGEELRDGYPFPFRCRPVRTDRPHPRLQRHHRQTQNPVLHAERYRRLETFFCPQL